jgi:hypothetical protein
MKLSLALGPPRPLSRSEARGCLTANLALPGSGSLAAGRAVGYFQMAFCLAGFVISLVGAAGFIHWYLTNPGAMNPGQDADPFEVLAVFLRRMWWPVFGIGLFFFALFWALVTSLQILKANPKDPLPPRIE